MSIKIILASGSAARQAMLKNCGINFTIKPSSIDEELFTQKILQQNYKPDQIAASLASEKAIQISSQNQNTLVIGSDQVLECEGQIFSKAQSAKAAKEKLKKLRGKTHSLISAVSIAQNGNIIWTYNETAQLTMHDFDDIFLNEYCSKAGNALTSCVGAYALEEKGAWLFSKIRGNYFTILGMPLLPLLNYLRTEHGMTP